MLGDVQDPVSSSGNAKFRRSEMRLGAGGRAAENDGARKNEDDWASGGSRGWKVDGKPEKLKLCLRRGGRWVVGAEACGWGRIGGGVCPRSSSLLCTKWQRMP